MLMYWLFGLLAMGHANQEESSSSSCTNVDQLPFPQVLQRAGKTIFRPGGTDSTEKLREWAGLPNKKKKSSKNNQAASCKVLEMAAGIGGLDLADNGCEVLLIDRDVNKLKKIEKMAKRRGLSHLIQTQRVDLQNGASVEGLLSDLLFDAVIFEASLSQYPDHAKRRILRELRQISPQILLHELGLRHDDQTQSQKQKKQQAIVSQVATALAIPDFSPMTMDGWKSLLEDCGYRITHQEKGPLLTLRPQIMLRDEGPSGVATIAYNLATHRDLRERVVRTKAVLASHSESLGYILVRAIRKE